MSTHEAARTAMGALPGEAPEAATQTLLPRVVVAAPGSAQGKTTVATGLMAALRRRGLVVAGAKVGPDLGDPTRHAAATGRPSRTLDPFLSGEHLVPPMLLHGARGADVAVVEGTLGLFDGRPGTDGFASTAHVAALTRSPVLLTLDVSRTTRTAAALVHGLAAFDPRIRVGAVVLNHAMSGSHVREVWSAVDAVGVHVVGALPHDPTVQDLDAEGLADWFGTHVDVDEVWALASSAPPLDDVPWSASSAVAPPDASSGLRGRPVVAVASGAAFAHRDAEVEELLAAAGLRPVRFDPLGDTSLPVGTCGIHLGGGRPEAHADALAANVPLLERVRRAVLAGTPTVAEGGGLLYLCQSLDGHRLAGVLPAVATSGSTRPWSYRSAVATSSSVLARAGERVTGHERQRVSLSDAAADAAPAAGVEPAWLLDGRPEGYAVDPLGTGTASLHASQLRVHWAGHPRLAERFADSVRSYAGLRT